jgi:hypothetical protein
MMAVVAVADDYALLDACEPGCRRRARTQRHRPAQVLPKDGRGGAIYIRMAVRFCQLSVS